MSKTTPSQGVQGALEVGFDTLFAHSESHKPLNVKAKIADPTPTRATLCKKAKEKGTLRMRKLHPCFRLSL